MSNRATSRFRDEDFADGLVLLEREDGIATVTLNRPEVLNALNTETWTALTS